MKTAFSALMCAAGLSLVALSQAGTYSIYGCSQSQIVSGTGWSTVQSIRAVDYGIADALAPVDPGTEYIVSTVASRYTWTIRWTGAIGEPVPSAILCKFAVFGNRNATVDGAGPDSDYHGVSQLICDQSNGGPISHYISGYGPGHFWSYLSDSLANANWNRLDYRYNDTAYPWTHISGTTYESTVVLQPAADSYTECGLGAMGWIADTYATTSLNIRVKLIEVGGQTVSPDNSNT